MHGVRSRQASSRSNPSHPASSNQQQIPSRGSDNEPQDDGGKQGGINAKLLAARKQRRVERLQNARRKRIQQPSSYKKMQYVAFAVLIICILLLFWLVGFMFVGDLLSERTKNAQRPNLRSILSQEKPSPTEMIVPAERYYTGRAVPRPEPKYLVNETVTSLIDMRDLNRILPFDNPDGGTWTQGWDLDRVPLTYRSPIKIVVVPHSHCDPGWLKTFDDCFQSQTKQILTSVVEALKLDKRRKFIWAEMSYFEWWWKEQTSETQSVVRELLKNKQLEFVTGGWVQPDEANTQLYAMEIQLQEGHDFINRTFGEGFIPQHGWSIDPFGYSPTMAYLLKKHKFKGMLIQRVHYAVKKELALHQHLEFMWRQTWDTTGEYDIFTHIMPFFSYDAPHSCGPDPAVCCQFDFARLPELNREKYKPLKCAWGKQPEPITDENVKEKAMLLLDQYRKKASLYRTNVVLAPLGDDFRYSTVAEANAQYENYQKLFDYMNNNVPIVSIDFGTLSEYFNMVKWDFDPPMLKGSFFTYSDQNQDYWSGYFTSRAFDKALDRWLERVLYAASSMGATKEEMQNSRRALSLFQHHDGVTGTATDEVVEDYAKRIHEAIQEAQQWMATHLGANQGRSLVPCVQSPSPRSLSTNTCSDGGEVVVYNPLETNQKCGDVTVPGRKSITAKLPCEPLKSYPDSKAGIKFDAQTGLMMHPIKENWMIWNVKKGGAYLFFPERSAAYRKADITITEDGYVVQTSDWKRTVVERRYPAALSATATVIDFIYETNLQNDNEEWLVRFSADIQNEGVFHTDLNGFNFDKHYHRSDLPIQAQVYPMPTLASIEDSKQRLTVLSEHAQGTASLKEGKIDVWLDRRLAQDDGRGLGQGVLDNVPTRTRLRVVIENDGYNSSNPEFEITPLCKQMWEELNHPLEMFGDATSTMN
eukprot:scaffold1034_cov127-Cylindrotheca_fusiformis.AAC.27